MKERCRNKFRDAFAVMSYCHPHPHYHHRAHLIMFLVVMIIILVISWSSGSSPWSPRSCLCKWGRCWTKSEMHGLSPLPPIHFSACQQHYCQPNPPLHRNHYHHDHHRLHHPPSLPPPQAGKSSLERDRSDCQDQGSSPKMTLPTFIGPGSNHCIAWSLTFVTFGTLGLWGLWDFWDLMRRRHVKILGQNLSMLLLLVKLVLWKASKVQSQLLSEFDQNCDHVEGISVSTVQMQSANSKWALTQLLLENELACKQHHCQPRPHHEYLHHLLYHPHHHAAAAAAEP